MVRETVLVVSNGGSDMLVEVTKALGCNVLKTNVRRAAQAVKRFIEEFGQGIPVAVIHGEGPNEASAIARQLKHSCGSTRVIAVFEGAMQPARDTDREYDVIIPYSRKDLQDTMGVFLQIQEV